MSGTYTKYPENLDDSTSLPLIVDNVSSIRAEVINRIRESVLAIESELGIDPSREFGSVRARLDAMELGGGAGGGFIEIQQDDSTILSNVSTVNFTGNVEVTSDTPLKVDVRVIGGNATQVQEAKTISFDGQTSFVLTQTPVTANAVLMFLNGIKQTYTVDYTVSSATVTWNNLISLKTTDKVEFWYLVDLGGLSNTLAVKDEGTTVDAIVTSLNFTGTGIAASSAGTSAITVTVSGPDQMPVTNITNSNSPYSVLSTDYIIAADSGGGAITVTLPASPTTGRTIVIKDRDGDAATTNITINGNGKNIDGNSSYTIAIAYESISLTYTGVQWSIL